MEYEIIKIHLSDTDSKYIESVLLSNGQVRTVADVVFDINSGRTYFYTTSRLTKANVETARNDSGKYFIRTAANNSTVDNLLSLPTF